MWPEAVLVPQQSIASRVPAREALLSAARFSTYSRPVSVCQAFADVQVEHRETPVLPLLDRGEADINAHAVGLGHRVCQGTGCVAKFLRHLVIRRQIQITFVG